MHHGLQLAPAHDFAPPTDSDRTIQASVHVVRTANAEINLPNVLMTVFSTMPREQGEVPFAVANYTDDVRIFAGCLTGRRDWPLAASDHVPVARLAGALAHAELAVTRVSEHEQRPRFHTRVVHRVSHAPFAGLNRAKAAVIEAAILVSRLDFLPREKIEREIDYLRIAVEKTAGAAEQEAWGWLMEKIRSHYAAVAARPG